MLDVTGPAEFHQLVGDERASNVVGSFRGFEAINSFALSVACRTIHAQEAPKTEPRPAPDLSRPYLVPDARHTDDPRIDDENFLALEVERALAGGDQIAAPISTLAMRQRDDEAFLHGLGNKRRYVQTIARATDMVKSCVGTLAAPGPAERHWVHDMLREPPEEPIQPMGHIAALLPF